MELYQLEYFRQVCKCGSYTEAAKELMVTQPAISIAIKKLEEECDTELIDRKSKTFALTQMGEALLKRAESIHNEMANIRTDMNVISQKQRETIRVAIPFTMCPELLTELAAGYIAHHTDISLHLLQKGHEAIAEELTNKSIDIGVICRDLMNPMLEAKDYKQVEFWACFSPEHRFNQCDRITPEMLKDETLILSKMTNGISLGIQKYFKPFNIEPRYSKCYVFPENTVQLAHSEMKIAFAPKYVCKENSAPLSPPLYVDLVVAWRKGEALTRQKRELIEFIAG